MEKLVGGTIIGALAGVLLSVILVPFGVHQAEWFLALGTVVGIFIGLLLMNEEEQPDGYADAHTAQVHTSQGYPQQHTARVDTEKVAKHKERK